MTLLVIASLRSSRSHTFRKALLIAVTLSLLVLSEALSLPLTELTTAVSTMASPTTPKYKLFDMPVSNNGARCRLILYKVRLNFCRVRFIVASARRNDSLTSHLINFSFFSCRKVFRNRKWPSFLLQNSVD